MCNSGYFLHAYFICVCRAFFCFCDGNYIYIFVFFSVVVGFVEIVCVIVYIYIYMYRSIFVLQKPRITFAGYGFVLNGVLFVMMFWCSRGFLFGYHSHLRSSIRASSVQQPATSLTRSWGRRLAASPCCMAAGFSPEQRNRISLLYIFCFNLKYFAKKNPAKNVIVPKSSAATLLISFLSAIICIRWKKCASVLKRLHKIYLQCAAPSLISLNLSPFSYLNHTQKRVRFHQQNPHAHSHNSVLAFATHSWPHTACNATLYLVYQFSFITFPYEVLQRISWRNSRASAKRNKLGVFDAATKNLFMYYMYRVRVAISCPSFSHVFSRFVGCGLVLLLRIRATKCALYF